MLFWRPRVFGRDPSKGHRAGSSLHRRMVESRSTANVRKQRDVLQALKGGWSLAESSPGWVLRQTFGAGYLQLLLQEFILMQLQGGQGQSLRWGVLGWGENLGGCKTALSSAFRWWVRLTGTLTWGIYEKSGPVQDTSPASVRVSWDIRVTGRGREWGPKVPDQLLSTLLAVTSFKALAVPRGPLAWEHLLLVSPVSWILFQHRCQNLANGTGHLHKWSDVCLTKMLPRPQKTFSESERAMSVL